MLINWFTVAAEIVNFLVLVALMKHFLYGPLIRAIDGREARIAAQLAETNQKNQQAELKTEEAQKQIADLENSRVQMIADARSEADRQKHELVQAARDSVRVLESKWREDLRLEQTSFFNEVRRSASAEIFSITRRALADLAGVGIERGAVDVLLEKLRCFDPCALKKLSSGGLTVVSAAGLSTDLQRQIRETIETRTGTPVPFVFQQAPEMAWGIELRGNGQRIGWTPDAYLDALEESMRSDLEERVELSASLAAE